MNNNFSTVILAAGLGKRMQNTAIPKVLAQLKSFPLLHYVLKTAIKVNSQKICIIVGHKKELVIDYVNNQFIPLQNKQIQALPAIDFAIQEKQLGTGHAVQCSKNNFQDYEEKILILSGDVPCLSAKTLENFITNSINSNIAVLTSIATNPYGYGRIIRDNENNIISIVEEKDATEEQKLINEINSGIYFVDAKLLYSLLDEVNDDNKQGEFYLTDIISLGLKKNLNVIANSIAPLNEILGVNTVEQLKELESLI